MVPSGRGDGTAGVKATGIVRRIDELGRIVIPVEIRRAMNIREGDPLEIFVDREGEVILKKYPAMADLGDFGRAGASRPRAAGRRGGPER